MTPKAFLFLQGPISPYFTLVGRGLAARGHKVRRINLNLGDWLFWHGREATNYRGRREAWPEFIAGFLDREGISEIVLLGEQRPYHKAAIAAAKVRGIGVTVTDFGYLRPDWITLERDGMSAASVFPRDPDTIRAIAAGQRAPEATQRFFDSFRTQAIWDMVYHLSFRHDYLAFPHYRTHQLHDPLLTYLGTGRRLLLRKRNNVAAARVIDDILARAVPFFVLPLQMETDFSLRAYSSFPDLTAAIRLVLGSFAGHAPADQHIVVKSHPLDPGLKSWRRIVGRLAAEAGIGERVHFVDGGDLDRLIEGSRGVVTINSTVGIRALQLGCPLAVLGEALYKIRGLAANGLPDSFWSAPQPPDPVLRDAFLAAIAATIQIRGVYYARPGLDAAVAETIERLDRGLINAPLPSPAPGDAGGKTTVAPKRQPGAGWRSLRRSAAEP